jgi:RecJ-like exonuclease
MLKGKNMTCQICGNKSGFYPLCSDCNELKVQGKVTKCQECGIWKKGDKPLCLDCYSKSQKNKEKESTSYKTSEIEKEDNNFRKSFPADFRTEDGHWVRSKAEQSIDNWLYNKNIAHAYERRAPIDEDLICDFYIKEGRIWIEYWGIEEEKYLKRKELKKKLYEKNNYNLIELFDKDIKNLDDIMPKKLMKYSKEFDFE